MASLWFVENVLRTTLSLFMEDEANSLPTLEEVLVCNEHTTAEEVIPKIRKSTSLRSNLLTVARLFSLGDLAVAEGCW